MGNDAHWHLLVNHFPIIASMLAVPMLLLALVLRKERGLLLASVFLLVAAAVSGWLSYESGEKAWSFVQDAQGNSVAWSDDVLDEAIVEHEERAKNAMWFTYGAAALGLAVLAMAHFRAAEKPPLARWWLALLLVAGGLSAAGMGYVGNAGGVIIHREIRGDSMDTVTKPK